MSNTTVGIRTLKMELSKYLQQVKGGATVTITARGKPVGRIVPVSATATAEQRVLDLNRLGIAAWNGRKLLPGATGARVRGKRSIAELLLENRE